MFDLDEYKSASERFFGDAVMAVARAGNQLLGQLKIEYMESLVPSQNTLGDGQIVLSELSEGSSTITFSVTEGVAGSFDDFHAAVAQAGKDHGDQIVPGLLEHISRICDATGSVIDAAGMTIWDAQLAALEAVEISFDADGEPTLPSLLLHPDTAVKAGEPPPGFAERFAEIIDRRRDEWLAGRRARRLPRQRQ